MHPKMHSKMYGSAWDSGLFMKNVRFYTICDIAHEPQNLRKFNCVYLFICKSAVINVY